MWSMEWTQAVTTATAVMGAVAGTTAAVMGLLNRYKPRGPEPAKPWTVLRFGAPEFALINLTGGVARELTVDWPYNLTSEYGQPVREPGTGPTRRVDPGSELQVFLDAGHQQQAPPITVRWMDGRGRMRDWTTDAPTTY
jgi:hypothetical protein